MRVHLHWIGVARRWRPLAQWLVVLWLLALRPPVRALRERRRLVSGLGQRARLPRAWLVLGWLGPPGE